MKNSLFEMLVKTKKVEELKKEVKELERVLANTSDETDHYEQIGDRLMEEVCSALYNKYNLKRLKTLLQINLLEKEILDFEINTALAD